MTNKNSADSLSSAEALYGKKWNNNASGRARGERWEEGKGQPYKIWQRPLFSLSPSRHFLAHFRFSLPQPPNYQPTV